MGKMLDDRGFHARGLALMKKSVRLEPNNERFWANLSFTYLMRGNPGAAMVCSEQAMALNPHDDVVQFVNKVASRFEPPEPTVAKRSPANNGLLKRLRAEWAEIPKRKSTRT
jgi:hypothetical protein